MELQVLKIIIHLPVFIIIFMQNLFTKKTFMKIAAWIFAAIAVVMIVFGGIDFIFENYLFGVHHPYNFFIVAMTFLLLAMFCLMMSKSCCNKEKIQ